MDAAVLDEKLQNLRGKLDDNYLDEIQASSPDKLKEKIINMTKDIDDLDAKKKADPKLRELKAQVSDLNGGYRDTKKAIALKVQYVILTLQERGVL